MKILVAMSGGVDSSVALLLTKKQYCGNSDTITGITLLLADENSPTHEAEMKNVGDARQVCEKLGVNHIALDVHKEFKNSVIDYFTESYLAGLTPNPCVMCNREIKFGLLCAYAEANNYDKIATGHYVKLISSFYQSEEYLWIAPACDNHKDQSYFLAMLSQNQLQKAYFPLGNITKAEVKAIAEEHGFVSAQRRESQDVCFIPNGDYVSYMVNNGISLPSNGNYVDVNGNFIGQHKGHVNYTIGQRKGLGIALGRHVFVLSKNVQNNEIILGDEEQLYHKLVKITDLNLPSSPLILSEKCEVSVKLRYAHAPAPAVFTRTGEHDGVIEFINPQRAPSPGQFAVMYGPDFNDSDIQLVYGAGVIKN